MKNKNTVSRKILFSGIFIFIVILIMIAVLLKSKMNELFIDYMSEQVTIQIELLADATDEKLNMEFKKMEGVAAFLNTGELGIEKVREIMTTLEGEAEGASIGLIKLNGSAIYGKPLNFSDFSGIQESFRGKRVISYNKEKGMLFTLPIYRGDNIKYVLYKLYKTDIVQERFKIEYYDGQAEVQIINRNHDVIVADGHSETECLDFFCSDEHFSEEHEKLDKMMQVSMSATIYSKKHKMFAFAAEIGHTEMRLTGTIPEEIIAEGLFKIVFLILWVFGLFLVLFIVGICYIVVLDTKVQEREWLRLEKMNAEKANKAKSDFLANMSHEIRTPINAVMGMNEMILRECKDENIIEYSQNIQSASSNLLSIINDILDFSKIEAGKMEIVEVSYYLSSLLNDVVNMIQIKANQKNLKFEIKINKSLPSILWGDEVRVRQVIINILNNAVKYTKEGSVFLDVDGEIEENMLYLKIAVKDTGIGIKEEDRGRLFGHFERLDIEKNRNVEGTGLGLAITYSLVQQMNGTLDVESEYGVGSTFTVRLPQKIEDGAEIGDFQEKYRSYMKSKKEYHESFQAPDAKVLIVDDNNMNLLVVKNFLKKTMVQVTTCQSGQSCLELMEQNKYHIVFLDHMMPGMDGIETLKQSKQMQVNASKDAIMVALTANAIVGVREMYLAEGFDDYLSKPVRGHELEEMMRKYLPEELVIPYQEDVNVEDNNELNKENASEIVQEKEQNKETVSEIVKEDKEKTITEQKDLLENISREQLKEIVKELLGEIEREKEIKTEPIEQVQSIEIMKEIETMKPVTEEIIDKKEMTVEEEFPKTTIENRKENENEEIEEIKEEEVGLLEKLSFLDTQTGLSYCCDSEEFYEEVLRSYLEENHYEEIRQYYEKEDWNNYMIQVHALKSTSLSIGATELSKQAKGLEFAAKAEDIAYIHQNHEETMKHYNEILTKLSTIL